MKITFLTITFFLLNANGIFGQNNNLTLKQYGQIKEGVTQKIKAFYEYVTQMANSDKNVDLRKRCSVIAWKLFYNPEKRKVEISSPRLGTAIVRSLGDYFDRLIKLKYEKVVVMQDGEIEFSTFTYNSDGTYSGNATYVQHFIATKRSSVEMNFENAYSKPFINDLDKKRIEFKVIPFQVEDKYHNVITGYDVYFGDIVVLQTETGN